MTAQDIIGNFQHERERFRLMRSDPKISSVSIRAISPESAEMNQVDPKRWVIYRRAAPRGD
jgi:hypothetical protein